MQAKNSPPRRNRGRWLHRAAGLALGLAASTALPAVEYANLISLHNFSAAAGEGSTPRGDLLLAPDGNFYGTTNGGGTSGLGSVYRLAPDGTFTTLRSFAGATSEGANPSAGLVYGADGFFYGTTYLGGTQQAGTVFKMAADGTLTTLASFSSDSNAIFFPYAGLIQLADGTFYGTTLRGGANDKGGIFKMTPSGTVTTLREFAGSEGANPQGRLVLGADGALYGTTLLGGQSDRGTIYKITPAGTHTTVYSFSALGAFNSTGVGTNADGANPRAGLLLGADGNFYGTGYQGGTGGYGVVFRLTPAGALTVLHAFTGAPGDGAGPLAGVTQDASGALYGTTERGGSGNYGTAWQITAAGQYRVLYNFTAFPVDGANPYTTLVPLDGFLYGVSSTDSALSSGTAFKLDLGTAGVLPVNISVSPGSISSGGTATLTWSSPGAASCVASGAWADTVATSGTQVLTPTDAGIYSYVLTCTDGAGVKRNATTPLVVSAPPAQSVDGGQSGGGATGALELLLLTGLAGLTVRRRFVFNR